MHADFVGAGVRAAPKHADEANEGADARARATSQIVVVIGDDQIDRIADAVVAKLAAAVTKQSPSDRLTVRETAAALRCCDSQVRKLIAKGLLRAEKLTDGGSSRVFVRRAEIDRLLAESARP